MPTKRPAHAAAFQAANDHQEQTAQQLLNQYFTPRWVAEAIVESHFGDLPRGATVVEPSCGDGRILMALPESVNAIGVEIDPAQAELARRNTGRHVITGDFTRVELPSEVHAVVGNPPFVASTVASFLERAHGMLVDGGRCGFILPAYVLQTSTKVAEFARRWSIQTELMPRNIFPGLSLPITFTVFTKDQKRKLFGFFLYRETAEMTDLRPQVREALAMSRKRGSVWRQVVNDAFDSLAADSAHLGDLYAAVERASAAIQHENHHVRAQVRKQLQRHPEFRPLGQGCWLRQRQLEPLAA